MQLNHLKIRKQRWILSNNNLSYPVVDCENPRDGDTHCTVRQYILKEAKQSKQTTLFSIFNNTKHYKKKELSRALKHS